VTPSLRAQQVRSLELPGRRVRLATLVEADYPAWLEVRNRCRDWLVPWEPRSKGSPLPAEDHASFVARCAMRERERQLGSGFGFGIFYEGRFVGEVTLSSILRGPFQNGSIGYWVDRDMAGLGIVPESVVVVLKFAFETLRLHRIEVAIIPRNDASRRVADKLALRNEGVAVGFLEINGEWEDHVRYAMTSEEWSVRRAELASAWID
jgi:ribosomal-protein-alanine N-acetyltransferase